MADGKMLQEENDLKADVKRKRKSKINVNFIIQLFKVLKYNGRATYIVNS